LNKGFQLDDIRQVLFDNARSVLKTAGVLPGGRFHKQGKALLEDGVIFYDEIAGNEEIADEMLQENLFSYHLHTGTVTFHSTPIQQYCHASWSEHFESK